MNKDLSDRLKSSKSNFTQPIQNISIDNIQVIVSPTGGIISQINSPCEEVPSMDEGLENADILHVQIAGIDKADELVNKSNDAISIQDYNDALQCLYEALQIYQSETGAESNDSIRIREKINSVNEIVNKIHSVEQDSSVCGQDIQLTGIDKADSLKIDAKKYESQKNYTAAYQCLLEAQDIYKRETGVGSNDTKKTAEQIDSILLLLNNSKIVYP